jgi:hypothetical protein
VILTVIAELFSSSPLERILLGAFKQVLTAQNLHLNLGNRANHSPSLLMKILFKVIEQIPPGSTLRSQKKAWSNGSTKCLLCVKWNKLQVLFIKQSLLEVFVI